MNGSKILVTGAGGFLGSRFDAWLRNCYPEAIVTRTFRKPPRTHSLAAGDAILDLNDASSLRALLEKVQPDLVFHFAGRISGDACDELYRSNVGTTLVLFDVLKNLGLKSRVIIPSSAAEYGNQPLERQPLSEETNPKPVNLYGLVKTWQTTAALYHARSGANVVIARIFNVLGAAIPESMAVGSFAAQLKAAAEVRVGNLEPRRDYLDLQDVFSALEALAARGRAGEIYNVCSGRAVSMRQLLDLMSEALGVDAKIVPDERRMRRDEIHLSLGSPEKTARDTGWRAKITVEEAVRNTLA